MLSLRIIQKFACSLLLLLVVQSATQAQNTAAQRKELERKRGELTDKIKETKVILEETRLKQKTTMGQLKVISGQIRNREKFINNVQEEIDVLDLQISDSRRSLDTLKADMKRLKEDYAQNILGAYKARNVYDKIMFVFASASFNQALKRIQYLNQYSNFRKQQAELILRTQREIIAALNEMIAVKREKMDLIGLKEDEKRELEKDKVEEGIVLTKLQKQEGVLRRQLADNEKAARKLNKLIEDLIAKEIEEARRKEEARRREEAAKRGPESVKKESAAPSKSNEMYMTPEAIKLSNDFANNKNNLPWPVEKGYISEPFGTHPHPTLKGVMINCNGVNISTQPSTSVRAVFKGKVMFIKTIPGMGKVILINHGRYYTAYAKLEKVNVSEGQEVDTKQMLGTVMTNEEEETSEVHFEIWNMNQKVDPELWLKN